MLEVNDPVIITDSEELDSMRLGELSGLSGFITEVVYTVPGQILGYMVFLTDGPYKEEYVWYIPEKSLSYVQQV